jgi:hypothetical protein
MKKQAPVTVESWLRARAEEALGTLMDKVPGEQVQALEDYHLNLEKKNEELRQLQETMKPRLSPI